MLAALAHRSSVCAQAPTDVQVRLKNGDFLSGSIVSTADPNRLGIQSAAFDGPLEIHVDSISSIKRDDEDANPNPDDCVFVLVNRSALVGKLKSLSEETITIQSRSLGELALPRSMVTEWMAKGGTGKQVFVGPKVGQAWTSKSQADAWTMEGRTLSTSLAGHPVLCESEFPELCEVRIDLAWNKKPGFMLALGSHEKTEGPGGESDRAIVRLESWDNSLVMIRESNKKLDFVELTELSDQGGRLNLVLFIDRKNGIVVAYSRTGQQLGKVALKDTGKIAAADRFIKLLNTQARKDALRLERIHVRNWDGQLSGDSNLQKTGIVDDEGKFIEGKISQFDAEQQTLALQSDDKTTTSMPLSKVSRAVLAADVTIEPIAEECVEIQFADNSSCIGTWRSLNDGKFGVEVKGLNQPLVGSFEELKVLSGNSVREQLPDSAVRVGSLESKDLKLRGSLSDSTERGALLWHAICAAQPCRLLSDFEGKITYDTTASAAPVGNVRGRANDVNMLAQGFRMFFGNQPAAASADTSNFTTYAPDLKFRTGDVVDGQVQRIDESGVTFKTGDKSSTVPHLKMESVTLTEFVDRNGTIALSPEKLKHLTTIPRAAKADPPTHLFVSSNGDYLRGRLVKFANGRVTAEIRLENVEFPENAIAQIYWLHSRDWEENKGDKEGNKIVEDKTEAAKPNASPESPAEPILQVHAMQRQEKAMTFVPIAVKTKMVMGKNDQLLKGTSELLGDCEVSVRQLTTMLIGRDVGKLARQMQKDAWKLSVATLPKVYQENDANGGDAGSPLIGKPAPDFTLNIAGGGNLTLSKRTGRVMVLDFWASWCGPCMQTMPEVDRIVDEVGGDKVELIAVNLQESSERALAAVKRLELSATVALDSDGEVAQAYQASAIPQTVIINREGKVTHVFVGGGSKFLKQFEAALAETLK